MTIKDKNSPDFGMIKRYKPTSDWVEENFTAESLSIIQQIAKKTAKELQVQGTSRKEKGCVSLQDTITYKHCKVEVFAAKENHGWDRHCSVAGRGMVGSCEK